MILKYNRGHGGLHMKDVLSNKIKELAEEATSLANVRASLQQQFKEIDTRLTQISGAIVELQKVQKELLGDRDVDQDA